MIWKKRARSRTGSALIFRNLLAGTTLFLVTMLGITLALTLRFSISAVQEKIEGNLKSTATALAESPLVLQALRDGGCSPSLIAYLDSLVAQTQDLDIVTIADTDSIRLYHVVHERIGLHFVGDDQGRVLKGEAYFSDAVGTMGLQRRFFHPVREEDGTVIGFVIASATMDSIRELRSSITQMYAKLAVVLLLAALLLSWSMTLFLQKMLLGFGPEELVRSYLTQHEMLNNLSEGVISVDSKGNIQLVNKAAEEMLGQSGELLEGIALDTVVRTQTGESLLTAARDALPTSRPNILACCVPLEKSGARTGTTLILTDKTEAMRAAEQLNGTRHIVTALRASTHEFMNKLQVISGLLQMDRVSDALSYIGAISTSHTKASAQILQYIKNPNVAALLLAKLNHMKELDIELTLLKNSALPEHSLYLSTADLVSVTGNLLENGIEAIGASCKENSRSIVVQITEDETGLMLMVSDSGVGIPPDLLERIYDWEFSTKAHEGRGTGMALVKDIVTRRSGSIEVDSEVDAGTTFTLIFGKKRERM